MEPTPQLEHTPAVPLRWPLWLSWLCLAAPPAVAIVSAVAALEADDANGFSGLVLVVAIVALLCALAVEIPIFAVTWVYGQLLLKDDPDHARWPVLVAWWLPMAVLWPTAARPLALALIPAAIGWSVVFAARSSS